MRHGTGGKATLDLPEARLGGYRFAQPTLQQFRTNHAAFPHDIRRNSP
jgi:hypothetical protein